MISFAASSIRFGLTLPLILLLLNSPVAGEVDVRGVWRPLPPLPTARQEVGVAELQGQVYVVGGLLSNSATDAVEALDTASNQWTSAAPLPSARHHVAAAAVNGKVYCIGGFLGFTFNPTDQLLEYDPLADEWAARASLPNARGALAAAVIDGKIYAVGGDGANGNSAQLAVYDPGGDDWVTLPPMPTAREHLAAASIGSLLYVVGGRRPNLAVLEVFDTESRQWQTLPPMPTARSGLAAASVAGLLFVFGGEIPGVFDQTEVYDPSLNLWFSLTPMALPRHGIGAAVAGNRIIIPGGGLITGLQETSLSDEFLVLDQSTVLAQLASGSEIASDISSTNIGEGPVTLMLEMRDDAGEILDLPLTGPAGNARIVELAPHQSVVWSAGTAPALAGLPDPQVGWATLFSDSPLLGHILFSGPTGYAGVRGVEGGRGFVVPVRAQENQKPAIAVSNVNRVETTVHLHLRDGDGLEVESRSLQLGPFQHTARFLDELFPSLLNSIFWGTLEGQATHPIAAMGISVRNGNQFATLAVETVDGTVGPR